MTFQEQLRQLRQQRKNELSQLHETYLVTKRDVLRKASPDRFVRKHMGATLGAAAIAGLLLAPRPSPRAIPASASSAGITAHIGQWIKSMLGHHGPAPKAPAPDGTPKPPKASGLLATLLTLVLGRLDLTRLIAQFMKQMQAPPSTHTPNGKANPPDMSVANAGTVKPDPLHDLQ